MENKVVCCAANNELPTDFADRLGVSYAASKNDAHKKNNGQFFTPVPIARFMSSFSSVSGKDTIKILDPGCGTAILTCALAEHLANTSKELVHINLTAYETDVSLIPYCEKSLAYLKVWLASCGILFDYELHITDFVLDNMKGTGTIFGLSGTRYDIVISNPPYFKLSKDDSRAVAVKVIMGSQTNIYSVFMTIAAKLLSDNGELIFITPRSFASGNYFKTFREVFFSLLAVENIHLFVSRRDTFGRDSVLQETVIIKGRKAAKNRGPFKIALSSSHGIKDIQSPTVKYYDPHELIDFNTNEKMLHLPVNEEEEQVINIFRSWQGSLHKYNIQVSTGPVVAFRAREFIHEQYRNGIVNLVPLFWLHNVDKMLLNWPVHKSEKGQYIDVTDKSMALLLPDKDYILLRRFSTKDDKSRLIAAPYFSKKIKGDFIGVENKVNYIYRPNGTLEREEIIGLCALLNSDLFDAYFRTFNGNVNVSATELRELTLPPQSLIKDIGRKVIEKNNFSMPFINNLINDIFELNHIGITHG